MKVLMLGNGFDLSYGLLTKYSNFLNIVGFMKQQLLSSEMKISDIVGQKKLHDIDNSIAKSYEQHMMLSPLLSGAQTIITFNYTNTYEMTSGTSEVFHLHGAIDKRIILGINPDECDKAPTADTLFIGFKKYFQRVMARTDVAYIEWIKNVLSMNYEIELVVMGHSLDITDQDIIKELFETAENITILYHDESAEAGYIANLVKIFGMEKFNEMRYI